MILMMPKTMVTMMLMMMIHVAISFSDTCIYFESQVCMAGHRWLSMMMLCVENN